MRKLKFAVLSYAHFHAYNYSDSIMELPNSDLVAVYDDNVSRGKEAAEKWPRIASAASIIV